MEDIIFTFRSIIFSFSSFSSFFLCFSLFLFHFFHLSCVFCFTFRLHISFFLFLFGFCHFVLLLFCCTFATSEGMELVICIVLGVTTFFAWFLCWALGLRCVEDRFLLTCLSVCPENGQTCSSKMFGHMKKASLHRPVGYVQILQVGGSLHPHIGSSWSRCLAEEPEQILEEPCGFTFSLFFRQVLWW